MYTVGPHSVSGLPAVFVGGEWRVLACLPETAANKAQFSAFRTGFGAAPPNPADWREIDLRWYGGDIRDQGMTSSCVGQATTAGMRLCWKQSGRSPMEFDPYFTYGMVNGGRDAGAYISHALRSLQDDGACETGILQSGMLYKSQFPPASFVNAKLHQLVLAYRCDSFNEICSALTLGFVVPLGILVDQNFSRLDQEGVAGLPSGRGGGGHAILGMGLKKSSRHGWLILIENSWGASYGMSGYAYIHEGHFRNMAPDAFAIQTVEEAGSDVPPVPEVPASEECPGTPPVPEAGGLVP